MRILSRDRYRRVAVIALLLTSQALGRVSWLCFARRRLWSLIKSLISSASASLVEGYLAPLKAVWISAYTTFELVLLLLVKLFPDFWFQHGTNPIDKKLSPFYAGYHLA